MAKHKMGTYTLGLLDTLEYIKEQAAKGKTLNAEDLYEILADDSFRTFQERLLAFLNEKSDYPLDAQTAYEFLKNKFRAKAISIRSVTIQNWLVVEGGSIPDYGDESRESMYKIAFALELDVEGTERLFNKVYLDKAFNVRTPSEFVYLYCISSGKSYQTAQSIIDRVKLMSDETSGGQEQLATEKASNNTSKIREKAKSSDNDEEIAFYIVQHPFLFSHDNKTALSRIETLFLKLVGTEGKMGKAEEEYHYLRNTGKGKSLGAINVGEKNLDFVLKMLSGGADAVGSPYISIGNSFARKEISTQFPNKASFSYTFKAAGIKRRESKGREKDKEKEKEEKTNAQKNKPSSYTLRKEIILMYFYWYWVQVRLDSKKGSYAGFEAEMRGVLLECGFSPLYAGNPYDCLFLYCSACYSEGNINPLDVYRELLSYENELSCEIDLSGCTTVDDLYDTLADSLSVPNKEANSQADYFSAFEEYCAETCEESKAPISIRFTGSDRLPEDLKSEISLIKSSAKQFERKYPNVKISFEKRYKPRKKT